MVNNPEQWTATRQSLLGRLKDWKDQESWRDFFDTYWKLIYAVARKAGLTDTEAQEVVQETVIVVARKIQDFKYDPHVGSFKGWLLHTTQWRISDQLRKRRSEGAALHCRSETGTATSTVERIPDQAGSNLENVWDKEWSRHLFDAAIQRVKRQVSARQYQIFDLYVLKEWPVRKVARTLGINVGQVYLARHRISVLVKRELKNLNGRLL